MNEDPLKVINDWYLRPIGKKILKREWMELSKAFATLYGDFLVQIGGDSHLTLCSPSPITHHIYLGSLSTVSPPSLAIIGNPEALPLMPNSCEGIVVPHVLEVVTDPERVLSEAYLALRPQGLLFILTFNLMSWWGCWQWMRRKSKLPEGMRFLSSTHLCALLMRCDYHIVKKETFCRGIPHRQEKKIPILSLLGRLFFKRSGCIRLIIAQKQVEAPTLVGLATGWKKQRNPVRAHCPEPSARKEIHE